MKKIFTLSAMPFLLIAILFTAACNQPDPGHDPEIPAPAITQPQPEDTVVTRLRPAITAIESKNLQMGGYQLKFIKIDSIRYEKISLKTYYDRRKAEMEKNLHLSTDKEKTQKVIQYLGDRAAKASSKTELYYVDFFMNAQAGDTRYQERHTNYLNPDLTELRMDFRNIQ
jgi:hypothetical protein